MRFVVFVIVGLFSFPSAAQINLPVLSEAQLQIGREEARKYVEAYGYGRRYPVESYSSTDVYLHYLGRRHYESNKLQRDADGVPMVKYGEEFQYNPVTISQFTLASHARYIRDLEPIDALVAGANKLVDMMRDDGALPYDFEYRHYLLRTPYKKGWVSGMAQGQALSALARAFDVTQDERYLEAGNMALAFLQTPYPDGPMITLGALGDDLSDYIFFEEYLGSPPIFTLNGYQFTLLGLYDWWQVTGSEAARSLFESGIESLIILLPAFDTETFTSYDLGYITHGHPYLVERVPHVTSRYHAVHIYLLDVLYLATKRDELKQYADRWASMVSD